MRPMPVEESVYPRDMAVLFLVSFSVACLGGVHRGGEKSLESSACRDEDVGLVVNNVLGKQVGNGVEDGLPALDTGRSCRLSWVVATVAILVLSLPQAYSRATGASTHCRTLRELLQDPEK